MMVEGSYLYELTIFVVELRGAWIGIVYAWRILQIDHLIIENDLTIVIAGIQKKYTGKPCILFFIILSLS